MTAERGRPTSLTSHFHEEIAGLEQLSRTAVSEMAERVRSDVVAVACAEHGVEYFSSRGCFFFALEDGSAVASRAEAIAAGVPSLGDVLDLLGTRVGWAQDKLGALIEQSCPLREMKITSCAETEEVIDPEEDRWIALRVAIDLGLAQFLVEEFAEHEIVLGLADGLRYEGDDRSYHAFVADLQHRVSIASSAEQTLMRHEPFADDEMPWALPESSVKLVPINGEVLDDRKWLFGLHWAYRPFTMPAAWGDPSCLEIRCAINREVVARRKGWMDTGRWWVGVDGRIVRPVAYFERELPEGILVGGLTIGDGFEVVGKSKRGPRRIADETAMVQDTMVAP